MTTPSGAPHTPASSRTAADLRMEQVVGRLLQVGVLVAAIVVIAGAVLLLVRDGRAPADFAVYRGEPPTLGTLGGIVRGALALDGRAVVQLGLVLLIATPVARVALTLVAFLLQRDRLYAALTAVVLALLVYGLVWGGG